MRYHFEAFRTISKNRSKEQLILEKSIQNAKEQSDFLKNEFLNLEKRRKQNNRKFDNIVMNIAELQFSFSEIFKGL